jgi:hypothetical protein
MHLRMVAGYEWAGRCGARGFTTAALTAQTLGLACWGMGASVPSMCAGLALQAISVNANSKAALHGAATDHAVQSGMGRGEFQGSFNNMRAVAVAIAPMVSGRVYARLSSRGFYPGRLWLLVAVLAGVVPELIHRSISAEKYRLKEV